MLIIVIVSSVRTPINGGDFDVYLDAARKLNEGQNIYRPPFINGLQYYYSVFFALLLIPFSTSVFITEIFWSLLSYFLLYRTLILIEKYFDFSALSKRQYRIWLLLTSILSVQFILYNVTLIQITFFLLWAMFESINLLFKGKDVLCGLLLGLIINIKLMPILLLPYLFYRGYFKALFSTIITFIVLLFLPSLFIGNDYNQFLLSEWWSIINPANKEHMFETGIGTHSLVALIPVYLTETTGDMVYKRNILNLTYHNTEIIINIVRLFLLSLSILYLKSFPFKKENNKLKSLWEISYFILMIPLL
ncbi:MAG TPA: glycosyltransferase family 87 protein, partial [Chitinophagaceae bacterium]|nr:glycosyltransferase family 87 protein [Chitinophagaceae bacterium]